MQWPQKPVPGLGLGESRVQVASLRSIVATTPLHTIRSSTSLLCCGGSALEMLIVGTCLYSTVLL